MKKTQSVAYTMLHTLNILTSGCIRKGVETNSLFPGAPVADDCLVLTACFDPREMQLRKQVPMHAGYGWLQLGSAGAFTFRMQRGAHMTYVLADAADDDTWSAMEAWHAESKLWSVTNWGFAASRISVPFRIEQPMVDIRAAARATPGHSLEFMKQAIALAVDGGMLDIATSDIAAYKRIKSVQVAMLETESLRRAFAELRSKSMPAPQRT